jgi:hypothetical protein
MRKRSLGVLLFALLAAGCKDVRHYSSFGDHYEGTVVDSAFVRAGVLAGTKACVVLDAEHLQDAPGTLTTSDGRFRNTSLRVVPQIWHDSLSTLSFGEGRRRNDVYVATPRDAREPDVTVFVSLMSDGGIEVRLLRGAPFPDGGAGSAEPLFGVFTLLRQDGLCTF